MTFEKHIKKDLMHSSEECYNAGILDAEISPEHELKYRMVVALEKIVRILDTRMGGI